MTFFVDINIVATSELFAETQCTVLKPADRTLQGARQLPFVQENGNSVQTARAGSEVQLSVSLVCFLWSTLYWAGLNTSLSCLKPRDLQRVHWLFFTHLANHSEPRRHAWSGQVSGSV